MPDNTIIEIAPPIPIAEVKKDSPQLVLEQVDRSFRPAVAEAIEKIEPYAKEIADASLGEYNITHVKLEILDGFVDLFMGYVVSDGEAYTYVQKYLNANQDTRAEMDKDIQKAKDMAERFKKMSKDFAGYMLIRHPHYDARDPAFHIWNVYVLPKYRNTNILDIGFEWLKENYFKLMSAKELSMTASRSSMGDFAKKFGFVESFTIYRAKL